MKRKPDLQPGLKVNFLTVQEKIYVPKKGGGQRSTYRCECVCGKIVNRGRHELANKLALSCGCKNAGMKKIQDQLTPDTIYKRQFKNYKRAEKKEIPFELTLENFKEIVKQDCTYCGAKPEKKTALIRSKEYISYTNGVDRVIPSKGYIKSNCVPCCKRCNIAKNDQSVKEFYEWAKRLVNNLDNQGSEASAMHVDSSESKWEES